MKKTTLPNTPGRQAAQKKYNAKPEQLKRRAERNATRAKMMKLGLVRHIDHNTKNQNRKNLRVQSASENRKNNR